jgi:hypothetical protein
MRDYNNFVVLQPWKWLSNCSCRVSRYRSVQYSFTKLPRNHFLEKTNREVAEKFKTRRIPTGRFVQSLIRRPLCRATPSRVQPSHKAERHLNNPF